MPFAGTCPDCDFVFEVTGTLARDDGNGACPYWAPRTIYNTSAYYPAPDLLGFASTLTGYGPHAGTYTDAFLLASYMDFGFGAPFGPSWWVQTGGGIYDNGTASYAGGVLEWTYVVGKDGSIEDPLYPTSPYVKSICTHDWYSIAKAPYAPGYTQYDSLPCSENMIDVFTFEGSAGGTASFTVDTTSSSPGLDPAMWVYGPNGCFAQYADASFGCAMGSSECPAMSVATDAGPYLLVVQQTSDCGGMTGDPGDYRLDVEATWDPKLVRIRDDIENSGVSVLEIVGSATITK